MQLRALSAVAMLALMASALPAPAEPIDPAQVIAQKFSEASDPKSVPKPALQQPPDRPDFDYEMDMLSRARTEEFERQSADEMLVHVAAPVATSPAVTAPAAPTTDKTPVAAPSAEPAPIPLPAAPARVAEPVTPEPPAIAKPVETTTPPVTVQPPPAASSEPDKQSKAQPRVTVLLVLDSDGNDAASAVKPDPIICFDQRCWISNGLEAAARPMPRSEALALKSTDTATSDSCSGKSACAFRNIALGPGSQIQVVEVGESRGVADGSYTVAADTSCRKDDGDLVCDNALVTHGYRIWLVPEPTAQAVGPAGLEDAVAEGLPDDDDAQPDDGK
jgi:hypothetical protein